MIFDPRSLLIAGGIFIVIVALAWLGLQYGKKESTLKPISFGKKE